MGFRVLVLGSSEGAGLTFHFTRLAITLSQLSNDTVVFSESKSQYENLRKELESYGIRHYESSYAWKSNIDSLLKVSAELRYIIRSEDPFDIILGGGAVDGVRIFFGTGKYNTKLRRVGIVGYLPNRSLASYAAIFSYNLFYDQIITFCYNSKNKMKKAGIAGNRIAVIPIFAPDLPWFDIAKNTEVSLSEYKLEEVDDPVVWYSASHFTHKGFQYYLKAASAVLKKYDVTFVVGGNGPLTLTLKQLTRKLGISKNVVFTGWINNHHMPYLLHKFANVCVSTSLLEQIPTYLMECMAAEKSVVASSVAGVPEIVTNRVNGYLVPPRDYEKTAHCIMDLLENPKKAQKMGLAGRKIVERQLNMKTSVTRLLKNYE